MCIVCQQLRHPSRWGTEIEAEGRTEERGDEVAQDRETRRAVGVGQSCDTK